jgi:hypothetical protein
VSAPTPFPMWPTDIPTHPMHIRVVEYVDRGQHRKRADGSLRKVGSVAWSLGLRIETIDRILRQYRPKVHELLFPATACPVADHK